MNEPTQPAKLYLVESTAANVPERTEVEAAHLSPNLHQLIAERFEILKSSRAVAHELQRKYQMKGITARTVTDAVMLATRRKPPAVEHSVRTWKLQRAGGMR